MKLNANKLGLSAGILLGLVLMVVTWISILTGTYAVDFLNMLSGLYPGFAITWTGSILGLIYGFIDGYVGLFLIGTIYNSLN